MEPRKEPLADRVPEHLLDELVAMVTRPQAIAMPDQETLPGDLPHDGLAVHDDPGLLRHIVEDPHVVVADEQVHRYAPVGEFGELAQQPHVAPWYGTLVFEPEVEQVAQQHDLRSVLGGFVEEGADAFLPGQAAGRIRHPQVEVAQEMDLLSGPHGLRRSRIRASACAAILWGPSVPARSRSGCDHRCSGPGTPPHR